MFSLPKSYFDQYTEFSQAKTAVWLLGAFYLTGVFSKSCKSFLRAEKLRQIIHLPVQGSKNVI